MNKYIIIIMCILFIPCVFCQKAKISSYNSIFSNIDSIPNNWNLQKIKFDKANNYKFKNESIIYIIDSGGPFDSLENQYHPDIKGKRFKLGKNYVPFHHNLDDDGHGTHIAGTISKINQVSDINFIKIFSKTFVCAQTESIIMALEKAFKDSYTNQIDVICNLSFTSLFPNSDLEKTIFKLNEFRNRYGYGVILVCAAGNRAGNNPMFPAAYSFWGEFKENGYENVISVGAIDKSGIANYSNRGFGIDVFAPGGNKGVNNEILSTFIDSTYAYMYGTSMATPHVVGAISNFININGRIDSKILKNRIKLSGNYFKYFRTKEYKIWYRTIRKDDSLFTYNGFILNLERFYNYNKYDDLDVIKNDLNQIEIKIYNECDLKICLMDVYGNIFYRLYKHSLTNNIQINIDFPSNRTLVFYKINNKKGIFLFQK